MGAAWCRGSIICTPRETNPSHEDARLSATRIRLAAYDQEHLLDFVSMLNHHELSAFLTELNEIDLDVLETEMKKLFMKKKEEKVMPFPLDDIGDYRSASPEVKARWKSTTLKAIGRGEVAVVLVAGGQGSRLGFDKPKGMYDIGLPSGKALFQLQAEKIQKLRLLASRDSKTPADLPWYIMTSDATHEDTVAFFKKSPEAEKHRGGLPAEDIRCFRQGMMYCINKEGKKVMLAGTGKLARSPNGNGGIYAAMRDKGILKDMRDRGVKYLHVYCVDNALAKIADPYFLGYCIETKADAGNKVLQKHDPDERVGVMCVRNGMPAIYEYSEISDKNKYMREKNGGLTFGLASICIHYFTTDFLFRMCSDRDGKKLNGGIMPYHIARKKIPTIDAKGKVFKPKENNGIKLEMFIFDAFNYAKNMKCFIVDRFGEFSPVKNPPGIGKLAAPDVARADVNRYHLSLLSKAGLSLPKAVSEKLDIAESNFKPSLLAQTAVKSVKAGVPMLVYVHGEKINRDGVMESWCPDCRVASKILFEELKEREAKGKGYILITLPVARAGYKGNASHMYRTNPDMKIEGVPTLFLWTTKGPIAQRTLGEAGCQSPEKVKNFLDYSYAISARNVEIPAKLSYDGEGLESAVADSLKLADPLAQWCSPGVQ